LTEKGKSGVTRSTEQSWPNTLLSIHGRKGSGYHQLGDTKKKKSNRVLSSARDNAWWIIWGRK